MKSTDMFNSQGSRRAFLKGSIAAVVSAGFAVRGLAREFATEIEPTTQPVRHRYRIGGCDWIMLKRQNYTGLKLAADLMLDGLEVDMGKLSNLPVFENKLRDPAERQKYFDFSKQFGVEVCSMAMSAFYAWSYADHKSADACTEDVLETMRNMKVSTAFLPFGGMTKLQDADQRAKVVARLKRYTPQAEKDGTVLAIEAPLDPDGYKKLLDDVGSPAVQVYYDCEGRLDANADIYAELKAIGKARLRQIHCTDHDGKLLKDSRVDVKKLKDALDEIDWSGWLVLERSRASGKTMKADFKSNAEYLKSIVQ